MQVFMRNKKIINTLWWKKMPYLELWKNTVSLTLSSLQTSTDMFANSVDPDEMACYKPSHLALHCLPFSY